MKKMFFALILAGLIASVQSCDKDCGTAPCDNAQTATLKDFTGLDGCGFVLVLADSTVLEPTNLEEFLTTPVDGQTITVAFHEVDMASICMVGPMVVIDCLEVVPE
jgi:hypothetical protein